MMNVGTTPGVAMPRVAETEWVPFPGGELEGRRPRVLCGACREQLRLAAAGPAAGAAAAIPVGSARRSRPAPLCFACYRAEQTRDRALKAAGELDTASEARFQSILPLEPVDRARLGRLRAERATARTAGQSGPGRFVDRRRRAQIAARHALEQIGAELRKRSLAPSSGGTDRSDVNPPANATRFTWASGGARRGDTDVEWSAIHAAELQFPEAWLPFVTAR